MVSRGTLVADGLRALGSPQASDTETIRRLVVLTDLLEAEAIPRGFIGEAEADRLLPRHVLESASLDRFLPRNGKLVDVGSGAGLPGLVLACLRRDHVVLVEPMAKRAAFLREVIHELGLQAEVVQFRAEGAARGDLRASAAAVTSRALAPITEALELLLPFAAVGGTVATLVGAREGAAERPDSPSGSAEVAALATGASSGANRPTSPVANAAEALGGGELAVSRFEVPGADESRWVMIVRKLRRTPDLYPRTPQARRRRPLGGDVA